ncbi:TetR family transcriptional regulator (plasmid) [Streptomyces alboflavus]|uniref:TetR family transcriptional regulator n=1 Tax=Streptomyces alboflavus TaxID=67267 RepID=A0A291W4K9_9ACTN|nr:TetR family transcriptional regulator [Streptomyces alboflavus]ATM24519.1 TetR family transcriptional regulator [Streptomyces alboflavus]
MPSITADVRAADGRIAGPRALATRQGLVDSLGRLLSSRPFRDIRVIDIARAARTSPATFYQYFPSVENAFEVLAAHVAQQSSTLSSGMPLAGGARAAVDRWFAFWEDHAPVLRVIDTMAAEGDERFVQARSVLLSAAGQALGAALDQRRAAARATAVPPKALEGVLVTLLASAAAHEAGFTAWGTGDELRDSLAFLVTTALGTP